MIYSAVNTMWVLIGAALVFFMQAGFSMCEAGFTRAKNTGNILMKNLMDFCIGTPAFWLVGFGVMFGGGNAVIGKFDPLAHFACRRSALGICDFPDSILCNFRNDCIRSHGGENKI